MTFLPHGRTKQNNQPNQLASWNVLGSQLGGAPLDMLLYITNTFRLTDLKYFYTKLRLATFGIRKSYIKPGRGDKVNTARLYLFYCQFV